MGIVMRLEPVLLPTEFGVFNLHGYQVDNDPAIHLALMLGSLGTNDEVLVRIHSECLTGEVFGSRRCDCAWQLKESQRLIAQRSKGIIIYLRQEGRGIGLANKLRAYYMQDTYHMDTMEANQSLGLPTDARSYDTAVMILSDLGIRRLRLLTNNPWKINSIRQAGFQVEQQPLVAPLNEFNRAYMLSKQRNAEQYIPDSKNTSVPRADLPT